MAHELLVTLFLLNGAAGVVLDIVAGRYRKPEARQMPYLKRMFGREAYLRRGQKWRVFLTVAVAAQLALFLLISWLIVT